MLHWATILGWFGLWWPLLFVGSGLVLMMEWALDLWMADGGKTPLPQRTLGGGAVLALILLIPAGMAASAVRNGSGSFPLPWDSATIDGWGVNQLFWPHTDTVRDLSEAIRPGGLLEIRNHRGSITVTGASQDGRVHVSVRQRLPAWRNFEPDRRREGDRPPVLETTGEGLLLAVNGSERDETDLTVEVPHGTALEVGAETGQLAISELRAPITIHDHVGDIVLTAVIGHMVVNALDKNATISGHSLSGDLTVNGRTGDLAFSDVSGPLALHGDFYGATHLERISGPVRFESSYTTLQCAALPGEITVEGRAELHGYDLIGPVTLVTTDRNVALEDVRGSATVTNREGKVDMSLTAPLQAVNVATANGAIHLGIPPHSAFRVSASTTNGLLENEFGLRADQRGDRTTLSGKVREAGPLLRLQTTNGEISLQKNARGASAAPAARDREPGDEDE